MEESTHPAQPTRQVTLTLPAQAVKLLVQPSLLQAAGGSWGPDCTNLPAAAKNYVCPPPKKKRSQVRKALAKMSPSASRRGPDPTCSAPLSVPRPLGFALPSACSTACSVAHLLLPGMPGMSQGRWWYQQHQPVVKWL